MEQQYEVIEVANEQQQLIIDKQIELKLIDDSNQQTSQCYTIEFDTNGSIMISGCIKEIKIWNFEQGIFKLSTSYEKHKGVVNCFVYNKQKNYFISGSYDQTVICWKQINQKVWICSQPFSQHKATVTCLILNKQEDQFISGGCDHKIIVWQVDFIKNELSFLYSLDNHTNRVQSFSFNQSETLMVSCGYHDFIIWEKGLKGKWELKYTLDQIEQLYLLIHLQKLYYNQVTNQIIFIFQFHYQYIKCFILWIQNPFHQ